MKNYKKKPHRRKNNRQGHQYTSSSYFLIVKHPHHRLLLRGPHVAPLPAPVVEHHPVLLPQLVLQRVCGRVVPLGLRLAPPGDPLQDGRAEGLVVRQGGRARGLGEGPPSVALHPPLPPLVGHHHVELLQQPVEDRVRLVVPPLPPRRLPLEEQPLDLRPALGGQAAAAADQREAPGAGEREGLAVRAPGPGLVVHGHPRAVQLGLHHISVVKVSAHLCPQPVGQQSVDLVFGKGAVLGVNGPAGLLVVMSGRTKVSLFSCHSLGTVLPTTSPSWPFS
mmetsp:Transcript_32699/g.56916  ORF Transcript_32699/g.56916 Transcript_32699/m.56916 type:complete len:278 (+) Transcript_32699:91-924(+)